MRELDVIEKPVLALIEAMPDCPSRNLCSAVCVLIECSQGTARAAVVRLIAAGLVVMKDDLLTSTRPGTSSSGAPVPVCASADAGDRCR